MCRRRTGSPRSRSRASKALGEHVAEETVLLVETPRVQPVQAMDPGRQVRGARFEHEVVVRSHQAERMTSPLVTAGGAPEQAYEARAIVIVEKQQPGGCDRSRIDVEVSIREARSENARHRPTVTAASGSVDGCGRIVALLSRLQCQAV